MVSCRGGDAEEEEEEDEEDAVVVCASWRSWEQHELEKQQQVLEVKE